MDVQSPPHQPSSPLLSRVSFVLNARSGLEPRRNLRSWVQAALAGSRLHADILIAEQGEEVPQLARRALQQRSQAVVAGGGDGTVNAVAAQLVATGIPLGILPLGTLNHFARELRIPTQPDAALRALLTGRVVSVDAAEVNGRPFVNNSSLGLYPWLVAERESEQRKGYGKWLASVQAGISVLRRYPFVETSLTVKGRELRYRTPFVFVGNNRYSIDAFRIGARESLSDGELCLFVAARGRRRDLLKLALWTLLGRLSRAGELRALAAREILIATRRPRVRVALDGEVAWMQSPLRYRSLPAALRVIVPAGESQAA